MEGGCQYQEFKAYKGRCYYLENADAYLNRFYGSSGTGSPPRLGGTEFKAAFDKGPAIPADKRGEWFNLVEKHFPGALDVKDPADLVYKGTSERSTNNGNDASPISAVTRCGTSGF